MLSSRIEVIETALASIATVGPGFIDQVSDFPAVALLRPSVERAYIGKRVTIDSFSFIVRGYTLTDEDSISASEALARSIEEIIQSLNSPLIYEARVLSVETDEGLLSPYGMCDIACEVDWINE
jgi:hypothetical protein